MHQTHHNMRNKGELIQRRDHGAYVTDMPDDRNQGFEVVREDVCFIKMLFRIHPKSRQIQNILLIIGAYDIHSLINIENN